MRKIFIITGFICLFLVSVIIQTSAAQDVIYGCYSNKDGKLRIISDSSECKKMENFIQWNVQGPVGPAGPQGEQGPQGECECPFTQEQLDEINERIEYLESLQPGPDSRFTDMGDGTVRDNDTGLIWFKNANCFDTMLWQNAMNEVALLESGYSSFSENSYCSLTDGSAVGDWRVPTKGEWEGLMSPIYDDPALVNTIGDDQWSEGDAFTGVRANYYWSSTEYDSDEAWFSSIPNGDMYYSYKLSKAYVWPVRNGND